MAAEAPIAAQSIPSTAKAKSWWQSPVQRRQLLVGLLFVAPWIVGFLGFIVYPIIYTIYLSFQRYTGMGTMSYIGLDNYRKFFEDPNFENSLYNTLYYTALAVPLGAVIAMVLALAMNTNLPEVPLYRVILFLPSVLPLFAISFIFKVLLDPNKGLVNELLRKLGASPPNWFGDPDFAKIGLVMLAQFGAGQIALVFLAGLKGIPNHLYEAAVIDGAGTINRFFKITLPLMTPVILYDVILGISLGFQVFTQAYIITDGGPAGSTRFQVLYLYETTFKFFDWGYASAMSVFIFALTFVVAGVVFWTSSKWVHYDLN